MYALLVFTGVKFQSANCSERLDSLPIVTPNVFTAVTHHDYPHTRSTRCYLRNFPGTTPLS